MKLEKLRAICDAATQGPWIIEGYADCYSIGHVYDDGTCSEFGNDLHFSDAELISIARNELPRLIALLEQSKSTMQYYQHADGISLPARKILQAIEDYEAEDDAK